MRTLVVDHPLVAHKLTALRDENTDSPSFRRLADQLVELPDTFLAVGGEGEVDPVAVVGALGCVRVDHGSRVTDDPRGAKPLASRVRPCART